MLVSARNGPTIPRKLVHPIGMEALTSLTYDEFVFRQTASR